MTALAVHPPSTHCIKITPVEVTVHVGGEARIKEATPQEEESMEESPPVLEEAKSSHETSLVAEFTQESAPVLGDQSTPDDENGTKHEDTNVFPHAAAPSFGEEISWTKHLMVRQQSPWVIETICNSPESRR